MLRPVTAADVPAVIDLVVAAAMFTRDEAGFLGGALLTDDDGVTCLVQDAEDGQGLASVVLYRPEEAAERGHDLTMIAVRPDLQGRGLGSALLGHAEQDLRRRGQRLMVVRTSGSEQYDGTRRFYRRLGYTEHTRVPDYWTDGDDLVLFTKHL